MSLAMAPFVLPPDSSYPLFVTANRYRTNQNGQQGPPKPSSERDANRLTLILLHSTSFHKETWVACLETLFGFLETQGGPLVQEAWSIECPNHGESAMLNAQVFKTPGFSEHFGCDGYSRAVHRFLTQGPVSFHDLNLIGIGHSLGANTILMAQTLQPSLPFLSLIIVEPMISLGEKDVLLPLRDRLVAIAKNRRDTWPSRDAARLSLPGQIRDGTRRKEGKGKWDDRVVDAFVKYGIQAIKDDSGKTLFTLACTRKQEIAMYLDEQGSVCPVKVMDRLLVQKMPIHLVLGQLKDFVPASVHDLLIGPASNRNFASVTTIPGVGHLVPQEQPDALAKVISEVLLRVTFPFNAARSQTKL